MSRQQEQGLSQILPGFDELKPGHEQYKVTDVINVSPFIASEWKTPNDFRRILDAIAKTNESEAIAKQVLSRRLVSQEDTIDAQTVSMVEHPPVNVRDAQVIVATSRFHTEYEIGALTEHDRVDDIVIRFLSKEEMEFSQQRELYTPRLLAEHEEGQELQDFGGIRLVAWKMHLAPRQDPDEEGAVLVAIPLFRGTGTPQAYFELRMTQEQASALDDVIRLFNEKASSNN